MTDLTDVEAQLRALLRDAHDHVDYTPEYEDKLLRTADQAHHTRRTLWPRIGAGLLAAALVAAVAIMAVVFSRGRPEPAAPTPSVPDIRILHLGVAPGTGLRIVGTSSAYVGNAPYLVQSLEMRRAQGSYDVEALRPGDPLDAIYNLPLASAQRLDVAGHRGFYLPCVGGGTPCLRYLAWLYRPHAWAVLLTSSSTTASALRDVATAVRFSEHSPMRTAVALPYPPQDLRPSAISAQYAKVQGSGTGRIRSYVAYGFPQDGGFPVEVGISSGSLSAKQRAATMVMVDGHRAYLTHPDGKLRLDFAPAPHQVVEINSISWTKAQLISFASQLRFAADLNDVHTWFDARSAVP